MLCGEARLVEGVKGTPRLGPVASGRNKNKADGTPRCAEACGNALYCSQVREGP
jgi:hypothetical protein